MRPLGLVVAATVLIAGLFRFLPITASAAPGGVPYFDHIFVIAFENHSYSEIIGNPAAPYINTLAGSYGLATDYHAVTHPSLPNYIALTAGDTYGISSDCTSCFLNVPNIADRVSASGRSWRAYMESMPSACYAGSTGDYAQKHDPFVYYDDIRNVAPECANVVPYTNLTSDLAAASTTPNYAFITPNLCDDMHDCSVATGDAWLSANLPSILESPAYLLQRSLVMITWDEDDTSAANQVATIVISKYTPHGFRSGAGYNHYSLLRTVEASWGLAPLAAGDSGATPMSDFFTQAPTGSLAVVSASPGSLDVFASGSGAVEHLWQRGGSGWTGWESLPGPSPRSSTSVVISQGPGSLDVFYRDAAGLVEHDWQRGGNGWNGAEKVLSSTVSSGLAAVSSAPGSIDVFAVSGGAVMHAWQRNGNGWTGWEGLPGGGAAGDPAVAVSQGPGSLDVFWRGESGAVYHDWQRNGAGWTGPEIVLRPGLTSNPAVVSTGRGSMDLFAAGGGTLLHAWQRNGNGWTGWEGLPAGAVASNPSVVASQGPGSLDAFWSDAAGLVHHDWQRNGTGWGGPEVVAASFPSFSTDPATVSQSSGSIDVLEGSGSSGWHAWQRGGNGWNGWEPLGGF